MTKDTVKSIPFAEQVCYNNVQVAVFLCVSGPSLTESSLFGAYL